MKIIGIPLRKPTFGEMTAAAVMAAGLWLACMGVWRQAVGPMSKTDAGAVLLLIFWGCACVRLGIRVDRGGRHLALNLAFGAVLVLAYQAAISAFS
jgi:hypothetical protein